jgi:fucose permease
LPTEWWLLSINASFLLILVALSDNHQNSFVVPNTGTWISIMLSVVYFTASYSLSADDSSMSLVL